MSRQNKKPESSSTLSLTTRAPEARVRRWAPRVRTGCTTCRTRHIKCDETRPVCGPCHRGRRDCRYTLPPPLQAGFASSRKSWPRKQTFPTEIESVDWEFQESFRFYFQVILPTLSPEAQTIPLSCFTDANFPRVTFAGSMARAHIERASQARGRVLCPGEDPAFQASWVRFFRIVALHIRTVNQLLRDDARYLDKAPATYPMLELLLFDLAVKGSAWTAHLRGFLAYVASRGGVSAMMRLPEPEKLCVSHVLSFTLQANTTCPAHQQIRGSDGFSDQDITTLLAFTPHAAEPCPVAFHLARAHITRLRVSLVRNHVPPSSRLTLAVQDIFDTLWRFDLDRYVEQTVGDTGFEAQEQARIMGRVYAVAIRLYGILTLPLSSVAAWAVSSVEIRAAFPATSGCSYESLRRRHGDELLGLLREHWDTVQLRKWLSWPLVVLGVAVAGHAADKEFVDESLATIWSSIAALEKLRVFWRSGKTGWEDCFDEPIPFVIW